MAMRCADPRVDMLYAHGTPNTRTASFGSRFNMEAAGWTCVCLPAV